jgi:hypothetical protein
MRGSGRAARHGAVKVRDPDLFAEKLDRPSRLQYVFDLFNSCRLTPWRDAVGINLSDDTGSSLWPAFADVPGGR